MCAKFPDLVSSQGRIRTLSQVTFQPLPMSKGLVVAVGTVKRLAARTSLQRPYEQQNNNDTTPVTWLCLIRRRQAYQPIPLNWLERTMRETLNNGFSNNYRHTKLHTFVPTFVPTSTADTVVLQSEDENNLSRTECHQSERISEDLWLVVYNTCIYKRCFYTCKGWFVLKPEHCIIGTRPLQEGAPERQTKHLAYNYRLASC